MRKIYFLGACFVATAANAQTDGTQAWLTTPNYSQFNTGPADANPTLGSGFVLAAGATSKGLYTFTPSGTINTRALLDANFYYQDIYGNQDVNVNTDGIDGSHATSQTVYRTYPASSPYNLLNFTSEGLNLGVICSQNNTQAGCTHGNVYGAMLRLPVAIQKGDIVVVSMKGSNSPLFYTGIALYGGVEISPGARGTYPYDSPGSLTYDSACYDENDMLDDYVVSGVPAGQQLKMGVEPIYQYAANGATSSNGNVPTGACYHTAPYVKFGANGSVFGFFQNSPYIPYSEFKSKTLSTMHTYVLNIRNDGSNLVDEYVDGALVIEEYYEQAASNPGWALEIAPQTIPIFNCPTDGSGNHVCPTYAPNDGGPIINGAWSATIAKIEVITGTITSVTVAKGVNGANSSVPIAGLPNYPN